MILDLGCGEAKVEGAIGVDNVVLPTVDVVHDLLDFPYPFGDKAAQEIYLNHVIEHFPLTDIQDILRECYRLLRDDGRLYIRVPHVFCVAAWVDVTHRTSFTFDSVRFWEAGAAKAYYRETESCWVLHSTSSRVTWLNLKRYRLRRFDAVVSNLLASLLNWALQRQNWPGLADLVVKALPVFFVEIRWELHKYTQIP